MKSIARTVELGNRFALYTLAITEPTTLVGVDENAVAAKATVIGVRVGNIGKIVYASDPNYTGKHHARVVCRAPLRPQKFQCLDCVSVHRCRLNLDYD